MTTIELHLTDGQTLAQTGDVGGVETVRDGLSQTIQAGGAINLNTPDGVTVVNSAHVLYVVVTP